MPQNNYGLATDYLDGLEVFKEDFKTLIIRYAGNSNTVLVLDPPYLCTDCRYYNKDTYFDLIDFLTLMSAVRPPFVFFSSDRSEFKRYIDYLVSKKAPGHENFTHMQSLSGKASLSKGAKYIDNMFYDFRYLQEQK